MTLAAWRVRLHPKVVDDLAAIGEWIGDYAGLAAAERKLAEIEAAIDGLALLPHRGSRRDEVMPGLRAIPAGRKGVIAFTLDDERREVMIQAVAYGGADWIARSRDRA